MLSPQETTRVICISYSISLYSFNYLQFFSQCLIQNVQKMSCATFDQTWFMYAILSFKCRKKHIFCSWHYFIFLKRYAYHPCFTKIFTPVVTHHKHSGLNDIRTLLQSQNLKIMCSHFV